MKGERHSRASRWRPALRGAARGVMDGSRLALAARTAIAAAAAWYLAPYVPFAETEYSFYAPLGVLVSMYPTIAGTARSGAQTLIGLALGIALGVGGIGIVWAGAPGIVAVALVVAVGVAFGGADVLGDGKEWVAMAGIIVLLVGGPTPADFSVSYLVTMAFGVVVGLIVNVVIFPPLYLRHADERLSALRDSTAQHLHDMAEAVADDHLAPEQLELAVGDLSATVEQVSAAVRDADESSAANPRARRRAAERERNRRRLRALERTVFSTRDLADVLAQGPEQTRGNTSPAAPILLSEAIHRVAELVGQPLDAREPHIRLDAAVTALERYTAAMDDETTSAPSRIAEDLTAAVCLRRIIAASRPFI
ncbi:hypothetical protein GCM10010921_25200 [Microbacterium album]|uniref:FUSC family protein n=2 Tax=Microbacterium album TaxID=2053191 RepID=A0A917IGN2_9MICO|nr:hypothetical protein GCM10010921_25200 [Microbacterium album]